MRSLNFITGYKDRCKAIYFREGYSFKTSDLLIQDGCLVSKEGERIIKAWGHSPKALLPLEGNKALVQLVNARDGNPCDPFHLVKKEELFSDSSVKSLAKEQHYKSLNTPASTQLSTVQTVILGVAVFLYLIVGIVWTIKNLGGVL